MNSSVLLFFRAGLSLALLNGPMMASAGESTAKPAAIQFNRDIQPILSETCFRCHGPDPESREADLRLDLQEAAFAEVDGRAAIVPGSPEKSLAWERVVTGDPDDLMPPPDSRLQLTQEQKNLLKLWIEQGAEYQGHWAFVAPERPAPPRSKSAWPKNDIDRFILRRLQNEKLTPSPEADRRTLIRRLTLDLTGLPPGSAEVRAFVEDKNPKAYENLVDRLLASRHFGERMAVPWLDQARYADTNGYSIDGGRHMALWRDWVIHAYNSNKPFDQFTVEQLAGDLMPEATEQQIVASGFNRNHMITHEGGTIPLENLTNYTVDRVNTTAEVWLGLTMRCAQCHDHKFDPFTMVDYYRMFAYFNTLEDKGLDGNAGINARPSIEATTVLRSEAEVAQLRGELRQLRERLAGSTSGQPAWEKKIRARLSQRGKDLELHPLKILKISVPNRGNKYEIRAGGTLVHIESANGSAHSISAAIPSTIKEPVTGLRIEFLPAEGSADQGLGFGEKGFEGSFILTGFSMSATTIPSDQADLYGLVDIREATASLSHPDYPANDCLDERNHNGWSPFRKGTREAQHITFNFDAPLDAGATPFITTLMNWGGGEFAMRDRLVARNYRMYAVTGHDDGTNIPDTIQRILALEPAERTAGQRHSMASYYTGHAGELADLRHRIANLEQRIEYLTTAQPTMVMNRAAKPRETFLLVRGQYDHPADKVTPGTPLALPPLPDGAPGNRLGFARWLVQRDHPLTARVAVNRLWQLFFGAGIVASSGDFGSQGAWPSHPDLLDWLAVEYMDSGWDTKALIRTMVLSAAYRQDSSSSPDRLAADPDNRLLARGPRFRLPAEFIRDSALKVSGLLSARIGGPSVRPYQPAGLWKEVSHYGSSPATAQVFIPDHGEHLFRRSLYTFWKRTVPPPSMITFDAPNRETCTISRAVTNTPLQALTLLNDPQFVEASRAFAQRILTEAPTNTARRIRFAFEECTSRLPGAEEAAVLERALERERKIYGSDPDAAGALLGIGESSRNRAIDPAEHAAWTSVASLIMNLSESITRE